MKDYYQYKKLGGYTLKEPLYRKTLHTIRCYSYYASVINDIDKKSETDKTENDIENRIVAQQHINAIEEALNEYVREEYQNAVFEHVAYDAEYDYLRRKYYISEGTLKRYAQMFIYGVAVKLGDTLPREK